MTDIEIEYFDTDYAELIDSLDEMVSQYSTEEDLIVARIQKSLEESEKETVIESERLTLRFCACKMCLGSLTKKIIENNQVYKDEVKIRGICPNLDHVYLRWLNSGKERVLFMNCPHPVHLQKNCYYLKGKAKIHLGSHIKANINDYHNVRILIRLSDRVKTKLINRHYMDAI